ncbi:hypothetical protein WICPIJ_003925 [Wickerhamomyces pijperi]|uniref:Uncharacterized protein n=1 Tax=Wickerhamomyces pijperi TaxID=599730 RepID=A0A9P8Q8X0_WICPI|nr:hypothetical protein WICPIJ_003925 [Wickerhamomyces pijperi]
MVLANSLGNEINTMFRNTDSNFGEYKLISFKSTIRSSMDFELNPLKNSLMKISLKFSTLNNEQQGESGRGALVVSITTSQELEDHIFGQFSTQQSL